MRDSSSISGGLEKHGVINFSAQMNNCSQSVRHHDQIGKDPSASEEHISLAGDDFDRAERFCECLNRSVESDEARRPVT